MTAVRKPSAAAAAPQAVGDWLDLLAAPGGEGALQLQGGRLRPAHGADGYAISALGIPLFGHTGLSNEAAQQQQHYDRIARPYMANLTYPHTQEYLGHLSHALMRTIGDRNLGVVVELCCGHGEALALEGLAFDRYLGVDVSEKMLEGGVAAGDSRRTLFVQGDATRAPISDASVDTVLMLGGIHHVPDRLSLFKEIRRILKPNGRFIFQEPASDFFLWRALRWIVYRLSPMLNHDTERPLVYGETEPVLRQAGLKLMTYETQGFLGFCVFMNSDVLVFNRLFRFLPGIRALTRLSGRIDDALLRLPHLRRAGLQVVGEARVADPAA